MHYITFRCDNCGRITKSENIITKLDKEVCEECMSRLFCEDMKNTFDKLVEVVY